MIVPAAISIKRNELIKRRFRVDGDRSERFLYWSVVQVTNVKRVQARFDGSFQLVELKLNRISAKF